MADNSSSLSLLTVLKPGGSSHIGAESKPAKTIDQMIALMSERGLVITDEAELRQVLFDCNYYRLSGYFRSFQVNPAAGDNRYRPGTRDVDFLVPYAMDEKLRNIILKGTAKVELTLRSRIAYLLASDGNAYTYMDPESYQDVRSKRGELLRDNLLRNMDKWMKMSNEVCMRHYRRKGGRRDVPVRYAFPNAFPAHGCQGAQGIVQISRITHQSADFLGGRACHGLSAQSVLASCQTVASGDGHPVAYDA